MPVRRLTVKEAAAYLQRETGMSRSTFYKHHREKLTFKLISPVQKIITDTELNEYINSLPQETRSVRVQK